MDNYEKQTWPGSSDQLLLKLQNKFRKIPLLVTYYLPKFDDVSLKYQMLSKNILTSCQYASVYP